MDVRPSNMLLTTAIIAFLFMPGSEAARAQVALPGVRVETPRDQETLKHDVNTFVSAAIMQSHNDESLERWTYEPICPLVAGLNKAQGEFILGRISQTAKAAGAPLGPEKCKPNFFVVVSADPEPGLKRAVSQNAGAAFNYEIGDRLNKFIDTPRPIRIWYNAGVTSIDGAGMVSSILDTSSVKARRNAGPTGMAPVYNFMPSMAGSRLNVSTVTRDILSVIVVVDSTKLQDINAGELGDYIGMIGLAQIDTDKYFVNVPTILNIFKVPAESRPKEMTEWDKALLHGLYSTSQKSKMQLSEIQTAALNQILTRPSQ